MADLVFFNDPAGKQRCQFIGEMNFSGKQSVLSERMPSILRDAVKATPRSGLRLKALWLGEDQWRSDFDESLIDGSYDQCLLIMVDTQLKPTDPEHWSLVG